jgi:hypothetical protein
VTVEQGQGCTVIVTYTWSGFRGRELTAQVGVTWPVGGGAEGVLLFEKFSVSGTGPETVTHTFDVSDYGSNTYSAFANLSTTNGKLVRGSDVTSSSSVDVVC